MFCQVCSQNIPANSKKMRNCSAKCLYEIRKQGAARRKRKKDLKKRLKKHCQVCSRRFPASAKGRRKNCSQACQDFADKKWMREHNRHKRQKNLSKDEPKIRVCVICDNLFTLAREKNCRKITCSKICSLRNKGKNSRISYFVAK
jgi:hypothetical protein